MFDPLQHDWACPIPASHSKIGSDPLDLCPLEKDWEWLSCSSPITVSLGMAFLFFTYDSQIGDGLFVLRSLQSDWEWPFCFSLITVRVGMTFLILAHYSQIGSDPISHGPLETDWENPFRDFLRPGIFFILVHYSKIGSGLLALDYILLDL